MAQSEKRDGFTLIELLVVIAIIAILASLVLSTAGFIQKKAARSRAEAEINALATALESYKADNGDYPYSSNYPNSGLGTSTLYGILAPNTGKVYFEFNKGMTSSVGITDPFGQAYKYQYPGASNKSGSNFFDLWSFGGVSGTKTNDTTNNFELWIKNW